LEKWYNVWIIYLDIPLMTLKDLSALVNIIHRCDVLTNKIHIKQLQTHKSIPKIFVKVVVAFNIILTWKRAIISDCSSEISFPSLESAILKELRKNGRVWTVETGINTKAWKNCTLERGLQWTTGRLNCKILPCFYHAVFTI